MTSAIKVGSEFSVERQTLNGGSAKKRRGRPPGSLGDKALAIRAAVLDLVSEYDVMTVRQVFYALTVRGVVPKDELVGYRRVQRQVLLMRQEGVLPWVFIADETR